MCLCSSSFESNRENKMSIPSRDYFVMRKYFDACKKINEILFGMLKMLTVLNDENHFNHSIMICYESNEDR